MPSQLAAAARAAGHSVQLSSCLQRSAPVAIYQWKELKHTLLFMTSFHHFTRSLLRNQARIAQHLLELSGNRFEYYPRLQELSKFRVKLRRNSAKECREKSL